MVSCSAVATTDFLMNSCFYIELSKHNFISLSFVTFALKKNEALYWCSLT